MPDVNWLFLDAPQNQNLKYTICFQPNDEILSQGQKNLILKKSPDWWRYHPRCDMGRHFMADVILLWYDILLRIKLSKL